jgi:hypothetical protein
MVYFVTGSAPNKLVPPPASHYRFFLLLTIWTFLRARITFALYRNYGG